MPLFRRRAPRSDLREQNRQNRAMAVRAKRMPTLREERKRIKSKP
jgi:hypothetical protein